MDFQVFQDPTECQECLAFRGRKDCREEMELKDRLVTRGSQGMLGQKGEKGNEGPRGKSGLPGMMGIKGTRGILGDQGVKGEKGRKRRKRDKSFKCSATNQLETMCVEKSR